MLLDQPNFECDPINRLEGDTPLHTVIRWINSEPPAQRPFGASLVEMMLEAGSSPRIRNKARLTPVQLVDPRNQELKDLIQKHEYAALNAGDFVNVEPAPNNSGGKSAGGGGRGVAYVDHAGADEGDDEDAEFSGSDEEERAEWERRRRAKGKRS